MIKELINLANELDKKGLRKEADYLDSVIKQAAVRVGIPEPEPGSPNPKVVDLGNARLKSPKRINAVFSHTRWFDKGARELGAAYFGVDESQIEVEFPDAFYDVKRNGRAAALDSIIMFTDTQGNSKPWSDPMWDRIVGNLPQSASPFKAIDGQVLDGLPYYASPEGLITSVSGVKAKVWPKKETGHPSWTDPNWNQGRQSD